MAGERTFLVRLIGNADGAVAAFKKLANEGEKTISQLQTVGNAIGGAFDVVQRVALVAAGAITAVAGAATAAALAAAEDEQSQRKLASQLQRTTGASDAQVQAVERFITSAMLATGVADTDLRNGFANLTRATGDATQSQRLLTLSLDISAATGKDLESVTIAVGKAASGQVTALSKLGIPIDENTKKTKNFGSALSMLETQFGGAAAESADTFSGRLKVLQVSLGEVVQSIGFALLPYFEKFVKFIQDNILPALIVFSENIGEKGIVKSAAMALNAMGDLGVSFIDTLESMSIAVLTFLKEFVDLGRTIALTVGFTAALTGNAVVALKATAASLMFKAAQEKLNGALQATPGMFDKIRNSMAQAAAVQAKALPNIIGTADALERAIVKGQKDTVPAFAGVGAAVKTAKEKLEDYRSSVKKVTSEQKSLIAATKGITEAKKQLGDRVKDLADREADVGERNLDLVKRQGDVVKRNIDIVKRKGDLEKREQDVGERNLDLLKRQGDVVKRNLEVAKRKGEVDKRNTEIIKREGDLVKRNTELAERQLNVTKRGNELAESNINLAEAQEKFNAAVRGYGKDSIQAKEAQSELAEAQRNVEQSGYRVERAVFAIKEAEEELKAVRMNSASTVQDIRRAEIDLAEAKLDLAEAQANQSELNKEQTDSLLKLNQTISGAVKGNKEYDKLFEKLEDAQNDQLKATEALTQASEDLVDAQDTVAKAAQDIIDAREDAAAAAQDVISAEEDVADAIKAVFDAQQDIIDAKQAVVDARQAIIDAEEDLADAIRDVSKAQQDIVDAKQAVIDAQDEVAEAHDKVREAVEEEAEAYRQLAIEIKKAKKAAEDAGKQFAAPTFSAPTAIAAAILPTSGRVDPSIIPVLPPVPVPAASVSTATAATPATTIVVNTGVGTNGIEAGRQIVQLLQQYTAVDAFAIDKLGFAPRR